METECEEINLMNKVMEDETDGLSHLIASGVSSTNLAYIIMPEYGPSLKSVLAESFSE